MIKIDKNIPLPESRRKYPLRDMEVGDSFFVEGVNSQTISGSLIRRGYRHGRKFACRTVEGGVRVWRVE